MPQSGVGEILPGNPAEVPPNQKIEQISRPGPSQAFVFMDESDYTINDFGFWMVDIEFLITHPGLVTGWSLSYPAFRHGRTASVSFADGHSELHKWHDPDPSKIKPDGNLRFGDPTKEQDLQWVRNRFIDPP